MRKTENAYQITIMISEMDGSGENRDGFGGEKERKKEEEEK